MIYHIGRAADIPGELKKLTSFSMTEIFAFRPIIQAAMHPLSFVQLLQQRCHVTPELFAGFALVDRQFR
jgi:hypothetical protein